MDPKTWMSSWVRVSGAGPRVTVPHNHVQHGGRSQWCQMTTWFWRVTRVFAFCGICYLLCLSLQGNFSDKPKDGILISQNVHLFYRRLDIQCALRFTSKEIKGQCTLRRNRVMFGIFGCCIVLCMDTFLICHESINKISKSNENTKITAKLLCPRLAIG